MFATTTTLNFCELFTVIRTDMRTGERTSLPYAPMTYLDAHKRAVSCQRQLDPMRGRFDYRVGNAG